MTSKWKTDSFIRTGFRHRNESKPCQDYVKITRFPNGDIYCGLCDGISSAQNSELASEICVTAGGEVLSEIFAEIGAVNELASARGAELKYLLEMISKSVTLRIQKSLADILCADTTYAFVYIMRERYALVGYIGDSCVCVFSKGQAEALTQTRDYGGATESIRHPDAARLMELRLIDLNKLKVDAFLLTSDGLEDVLYTKGSNGNVMHDSQLYINTLFETQGHQKLADMIDDVCADGSYDDDISLALLARKTVTVPSNPTWLCTCGARNTLNTPFCEYCSSDVLEIYKDAPMNGFNSLWEFFDYLNANPEEERQMVGLTEPSRNIDMTLDMQLQENCSENDSHCTVAVETEEPLSQNKKHSANGCRKPKHRRRLPSRLAVAGAAVLIIMGSMTTLAFFQSLSISRAIEELQGEVDGLKEEISDLHSELHAATPSEAEPFTSNPQESYQETQPEVTTDEQTVYYFESPAADNTEIIE